MNILLAYATYSGGTQSASEFLSQTLTGLGHTVTVKMVSEVTFEDTLNYDLRIFASPSWDNDGQEGQPHVDFVTFMNNAAGKKFAGKPVAVFGLGDSSYGHFCGAADIITDFVKKAEGKLIAETLKIDGYLFNMDANNQLLTDWANKLKV
jgi:flavodoxin I